MFGSDQCKIWKQFYILNKYFGFSCAKFCNVNMYVKYDYMMLFCQLLFLFKKLAIACKTKIISVVNSIQFHNYVFLKQKLANNIMVSPKRRHYLFWKYWTWRPWNIHCVVYMNAFLLLMNFVICEDEVIMILDFRKKKLT